MTITYGKISVIENLSFSLEKGEMVAVTGASGSGKTSLLCGILGFVPLTSGEIRFAGNVMKSGAMEQLRHNSSFLPQELSFPCEFVSEVMEIPFTFRCNRLLKVSDALWKECFAKLGLDESIREKRLNEISGGQKQRLMLAVTAMLDKDVIFLDEPTSALDTESAELVLSFIKELTNSGKAVLVVTHDRLLAEGCNRIIELTNVVS